MDSLPTMVRLGTRGSALARWQADHIAERIRALGVQTEIVLIQTTGDIDMHPTFGEIPDKGVFVKELEIALLERRIDLAVHSLKDLPTSLPNGLTLAAVPERESPLDAFISASGKRFEDLPQGARVASSSLRRQAQVLALRPDLEVVPIRGNVPTRIEKIRQGHAEGGLLAVAGLRRLGLEREITQIFTPDQITPPMGQGALAIEARAGEFQALWDALDDPATRLAVEAERVFLAIVGGGCRTPVGIHARLGNEGDWLLTGMISSPDGRSLLRRDATAEADEGPIKAADDLARAMLAEASPEICATLARAEFNPPPEA